MKKKSITLGFIGVILFLITCIPVKVNAATNLTPIMGQATATKEQMMNYLMTNNPNKSFEDTSYFVQTVIDEANIEGVKPDIAFVQMMKETNFLKFTGVVKEKQNNFGGLGATGQIDPTTGQPVTGLSFESIQVGIRANIQHLKAYGSDEILKQDCVDPRFKFVTRKSAEFVEWLGIKENPTGAGWATDANYGYDIVSRLNIVKGLNPVGQAKNASYSFNSEDFYINKATTIVGTGTANNKLMYQYWIRDLDKENWKVLKDWSEDGTLNWVPENIGNFRIELHIKDIYSKNAYDSFFFRDVTVKKPVAKNATISFANDKFYKNKQYIVTGNSQNVNGAVYQYWIRDLDKNNWTVLRDWNSDPNYVWTQSKPGAFRIEVHVKDVKSDNIYDSFAYKDVVVNESVAGNASYTINSDKFYVNNTYTINGSGNSVNGVLYQYWIRDLDKNNWTILKDWSDSNIIDWSPNSSKWYRIEMHIKDKESINYYDAFYYKDIKVELPNGISSNASFKIDENNLYTGKATAIYANSSSTNKSLYQYWIRDLDKDNWTVLSDWNENSEFNYKPTKSGKYRIELHTKDIYSSNAYDSFFYKDIVVKDSIAINANYSIDNNNIVVNKKYVVTGSGNSPNEILYQYWIRDIASTNWKLISDWSKNKALTWVPDKEGSFRLELHIKDMYSSSNYDAYYYKDISVESPKAVDAKFTINSNELLSNNSYALSSSGSSDNKILYQYWIRDLDKDNWSLISDWSDKNSISWKPAKYGNFRVELHIKDELSTRDYDSFYFMDIRVDDPNGRAQLTNFDFDDVVRPNINYLVSGSAKSNNAILYQYWIRDLDKDNWSILKDWSLDSTLNWKPTKPGKYRIELHTKDKISKASYDDLYFKDITVSSYIIILDAGHGGSDGGATNKGVNEKDINLAITLKAKAKLEELGIYVVLTRSDDTYVSLEDRTKLANKINPDLFISIHANSNDNSSASGVEVWHSLRDPLKADGKKIADLLTNYVSQLTGEKNRGAKTMSYPGNPSTDYYYVIRETSVISVILETGFLSNSGDEKGVEYDFNKLTDSFYQNQYAEAVKSAAKSYFNI